MDQASFTIKEEMIDTDESWHNEIKSEPMSPPSMNAQNKELDEIEGVYINMKVEENLKAEVSDLLEEINKTRSSGEEGHGSTIHSNIIIKKELIDSEEFWQDNIKCEPSSPVLMNTHGEESADIYEQDVNVKGSLMERNRPPYFGCSAACYSSASASASTQHPSALTIEMNCRKHYSKNCACWRVHLKNPQFQKSFPSPSSSATDETRGLENDADRYMSEGHGEDSIYKEISETKTRRGRHELKYTTKRRYECSHCGKCVRNNSHLVAHTRTHTDEKPYECDRCGKSFKARSRLIVHMQTHTGTKPYKCHHCGNSFRQKRDLVLHIRSHTGERPLKCKVCGKAFNRNEDFARHQRTHSGEKPFKCPQCGKSFTQSCSVKKHMRIHTGEKPFKCNDCGKTFKSKYELVQHVGTHIGERHHQCTQCGRSFMQKSYLKMHMRTHTGEQI